MKNRVVVLGSQGMAGHMIANYLKEQDLDLFEAARFLEDGDRTLEVDALKPELVVEKLKKIKPDMVINCIGLLQKECNTAPERAIFVNSYFPQYLAAAFRDTKIKLVHMSTDCVFSGKNAPYKEDDFKDGDSIYDRTKALGEIVNDKDLTLRTSIIGPDINEHGSGLFNWFMHTSGEIKGFTNAYWNGLTTLELAKVMLKSFYDGIIGLYQPSPKQNINKYDLLLLFKKYFKKDVTIVPDDKFAVDKTLVNTRTDFKYEPPTYDVMISEMYDWCSTHSHLYSFMGVDYD